ncbi:hypothetical protein SBADM41S_02696 [Streptomyces badius]
MPVAEAFGDEPLPLQPEMSRPAVPIPMAKVREQAPGIHSGSVSAG